MTRLDELNKSVNDAFDKAIMIQKRCENYRLMWQLESIRKAIDCIETEERLQDFLYKHYTDALALATAVSNIYGAYQKARESEDGRTTE